MSMLMDDDEYEQYEPESPKQQPKKGSIVQNVLGKGTARKPSKTFISQDDQQKQSSPNLDDLGLDEESQSVISSVGKINKLNELEQKISRLRSTVGQLKQQYDAYKSFKELLENARHGNLFNDAELKPLDDVYRKEKDNLMKKIEWSLELVKDLKAIYEKKQKLILGLARSKTLPAEIIKKWEASLQKSDTEIAKHTQYALHFQALFPKK